METIADAWDLYRTNVIADDSPSESVDLVSRVFFAGATAVFALIQDAHRTAQTAEEALVAYKKLEAECWTIARSMKEPSKAQETSH